MSDGRTDALRGGDGIMVAIDDGDDAILVGLSFDGEHIMAALEVDDAEDIARRILEFVRLCRGGSTVQ